MRRGKKGERVEVSERVEVVVHGEIVGKLDAGTTGVVRDVMHQHALIQFNRVGVPHTYVPWRKLRRAG